IGNKDLNITKEFAIVSDSDKIDAMGAIGIARAFAYGIKHGDPIYDPNIKSDENITQEEYKNTKRKSTILNHFDEKLLKLDKYLLTNTGKEIAKPRMDILKNFKEQFMMEWYE
ncbi:MAG: phosphohydrolase, partial [archaeon]|nr:phosphohydrolase [archaeon]